LGIIGVLLIDIIGSVFSRRLQFNYVYFAIFTVINYFLTAYYMSFRTDFNLVLLFSGLLVLFDATIGTFLSKRLKAYAPSTSESRPVSNMSVVIVSIFVGLFFGCIGYFAAR